jgi:hypothetical protein
MSRWFSTFRKKTLPIDEADYRAERESHDAAGYILESARALPDERRQAASASPPPPPQFVGTSPTKLLGVRRTM